MQTILLIKSGRVYIQTAEKTYTDTVENFVLDGGVLPTDFTEIDYCRDTGSCVIDGVASDVPAYATNIISRFDEFFASYESRKEAREEAERIARDEQHEREIAEAEQARIDAMTPEERAEYDLGIAKDVRSDAVDAIVVTVDGMQFDGDEDAQRRMTVAVSTARSRADRLNSALQKAYELELQTNPDAVEPEYDNYLDYETTWVLADNSIVTVTIAQLSLACEMAGTAQTALWTVPYQ